MTKELNTSEELKYISERLREAEREELQAEVVYYALKYMREDPELTPSQAFQMGGQEWDI